MVSDLIKLAVCVWEEENKGRVQEGAKWCHRGQGAVVALKLVDFELGRQQRDGKMSHGEVSHRRETLREAEEDDDDDDLFRHIKKSFHSNRSPPNKLSQDLLAH